MGGSGWQATESEASQAAGNAALAEITNYLGASVKAVTKDLKMADNDKESQKIENTITVVGAEVTLRGIERRAIYWNSVRSGYDCTVLVSYPRAEYEKAKAEIAAAQLEYKRRNAQSAARALELYRSARSAEAAKDYENSLKDLLSALEIVKKFEGPVDLEDQSLKNTGLLLPELSQWISVVGKMVKDSGKWLAVGIVTELDTRRSVEHEQALFAKVAALAQTSSFKPRSTEMSHEQAARCLAGDGDAVRLAAGPARYLLVLDMDSQFSTEVSGQFFAAAIGKWALMESVTGNVIVSGLLPRSKGYGVSRASACSMGAELLHKQVVADLSKAFEQIRQK
jgi:hypothetical protein